MELKIKQASKRQSEIEKNEEKQEEIRSHRINIDDITMIKVRLQVERDNLKGNITSGPTSGLILSLR